MSQRIDPKLAEKIADLVDVGVTSVKEMKRHLEYYVRKELFPGRTKPYHSNRRFYPKKCVIRNKMYKVYIKKRFSKIDQENLSEIVKNWENENPFDKFYFRPYAQVDKRFFEDGREASSNVEDEESAEDDIKVRIVPSKQQLMFVHQTTFQRGLLKRYGNYACFLDATYKTTKYALPLFFLAVKTNVDYQIAGSFVIQDERKDSIKEALEIIQSWNSTLHPTIFMTDFDEEEIHAIEETFPGMRSSFEVLTQL